MAALDQVQIRKLAKRYGSERALAGVTLDLAAGSMCALLGHNGAGKTTLLGIVSTLVRPTSGTVAYRAAGAPVTGAAVRRDVMLIDLKLPREAGGRAATTAREDAMA